MNTAKFFVILAMATGGLAAHATEKGKANRQVADVGAGSLLECKGERGTLAIRRTAVPTRFQGALNLSGKDYTLTCERVNEAPSNLNHLWNCAESRGGDGRVLVGVESGGVTGATSAYVAIEQIFPLHPQSLATLNCANP